MTPPNALRGRALPLLLLALALTVAAFLLVVDAPAQGYDDGSLHSPQAESAPNPQQANSVTFTVTRRANDPTKADASWTESTLTDFGYYRLVACRFADSDSAPSCKNNVYEGQAIFTKTTTTEEITGLVRDEKYRAIIQVWHAGHDQVDKYSATIAAVPTPTPTPVPPTPTPTPVPPTPTPTPVPPTPTPTPVPPTPTPTPVPPTPTPTPVPPTPTPRPFLRRRRRRPFLRRRRPRPFLQRRRRRLRRFSSLTHPPVSPCPAIRHRCMREALPR